MDDVSSTGSLAADCLSAQAGEILSEYLSPASLLGSSSLRSADLTTNIMPVLARSDLEPLDSTAIQRPSLEDSCGR